MNSVIYSITDHRKAQSDSHKRKKSEQLPLRFYSLFSFRTSDSCTCFCVFDLLPHIVFPSSIMISRHFSPHLLAAHLINPASNSFAWWKYSLAGSWTGRQFSCFADSTLIESNLYKRAYTIRIGRRIMGQVIQRCADPFRKRQLLILEPLDVFLSPLRFVR